MSETIQRGLQLFARIPFSGWDWSLLTLARLKLLLWGSSSVGSWWIRWIRRSWMDRAFTLISVIMICLWKRERERGEDRGRDGFRNLGDVFKTLEGNFLTTLWRRFGRKIFAFILDAFHPKWMTSGRNRVYTSFLVLMNRMDDSRWSGSNGSELIWKQVNK